MIKWLHFVFFVLISIANLNAAIWLVGPLKAYSTPSQVSTLVQNGDTVNIDAAIYSGDVAKWSADNLLIRGSGGFAHMKSNGNSYGGKAIWVIGGNNTTVEWIEFSECSVADHNGAGIRQEGTNLTVRHCYFHDNEEGILAGTVNPSNILIEFTEFDHNGYGDGYSHNLYINNIDTLFFQFNYSHHAVIGHELKSRAHVNYILYNRIGNEATGTASREIDLPNGGQSILIGNEIEQGPNSENSNIIGFGLEGLSNPSPHEIYLVNNTLVNEKTVGSFLQVQSGTSLLKSYNNIFAGSGTLISGTANTIDTSGNWNTADINSVAFENSSSYNYHLNSNSPAIDIGENAGATNSGFNLNPYFEFLNPEDSISRNINGALDCGAFEFSFPLGVNEISNRDISIFINEVGGIHIHISSSFHKLSQVQIFNITGQVVYSHQFENTDADIKLFDLPASIYFIEASTAFGNVQKKWPYIK